MWILLWGCVEPGTERPPATPTPLPAEPFDGPPNLLLVILDDVGVDRLSAYGHENRRTPTLDRLAAEGRRFDNAWAYPSCSPSRASAFTGRHARRHGYGSNLEPSAPYALDPAETTLAEMLREAPVPYTSLFLGKWHLEGTGARWVGPVGHGWDLYAGARGNLTESYFSWTKRESWGELVHTEVYATTDTANDTLDAVTTLPEPWFVTAAFHAPHPPLHDPPPELVPQRRVSAQSDPSEQALSMLEAWDTEFARVVDGMDPAVRARTWIVVLGDNGDFFLDDAVSIGTGKLTLQDGGVHVPLIVAGPGVTEPGSSSPALVSVVDLFPTFAELAGVDVATLRDGREPDGRLVLDGASLLPALADPDAPVHEAILSEKFESGTSFAEYQVAARNRTHKLWVDLDGDEHLYVYDDPSTTEEPRKLSATGIGLDDHLQQLSLREAIRAHVVATTPLR